jgi:hypothetical protein
MESEHPMTNSLPYGTEDLDPGGLSDSDGYTCSPQTGTSWSGLEISVFISNVYTIKRQRALCPLPLRSIEDRGERSEGRRIEGKPGGRESEDSGKAKIRSRESVKDEGIGWFWFRVGRDCGNRE